MKRVIRWCFALMLLALAAAPAAAIDISGTRVVIPVIARVPGAAGSVWRTDLFLGNYSSASKTLTLTFYHSGVATPIYHNRTMDPYSSQSLTDVVKTVFGRDEASGQLEITVPGDSQFEARARIYNIGGAAGEFGQNVQGIGFQYLQRQSYIFGLDGRVGNRLNVGIANPHNTSIEVNIRLRLGTGEEVLSVDRVVAARTTLQINDIIAVYALGRNQNIEVHLNTFGASALPFYGYVSQVRNDSNDPIFLFGTSPNV